MTQDNTELLPCICMEVHGENPDCPQHGDSTDWARDYIDAADWQERVLSLRDEIDRLNTRPTQGHDALEAAARFLCDRLDELEWHDGELDRTARDYMGHVDPAHSRLKNCLTNLPTPQAEEQGIDPTEAARYMPQAEPSSLAELRQTLELAKLAAGPSEHRDSKHVDDAPRLIERALEQLDGLVQAEEAPSDGLVSLTFAHFRQVNERRCVEAFKHNLDDWSLSDWFTATLGELGEAANIAKKLNRIRDGIDDANAEHETLDYLTSELADEIADTFIYLDLLAASQGIALQDAVASKFNKTSDKLGAPHKITALRSRLSGDGEGK